LGDLKEIWLKVIEIRSKKRWISVCGSVGILAGGGEVFVVVIGTVTEYEESGSESSGSWMYSDLDWIGTLRSCEIS
jgi:hypothetical protein